MQLNPAVDSATIEPAAARVPPLAAALLAQLLGWAAVTALEPFLLAWGEPGLVLPLAQGVVSAVCGQALGLPQWWFLLNLAFAPAAHWTQTLAIDPDWFLMVFLVLVLLFWSTYRTQVPLYLSSREACDRVAELLPRAAGARVLDLGCGLGGVVARLGRLRPDCSVDGIELAPLPALLTWLRLRGRPNCGAAMGDFWRQDLSGYDVVYAFLSPAAMPDLWRKARVEMKPGSLLVSNSFPIRGVEPHAVVPLSGRGSRALFLWRM